MRRRALLSSGKKDYSKEYFTMVVTVGGDITVNDAYETLFYSKDNGATWKGTMSGTIPVAAGDKVIWKATLRNQKQGMFNSTTDVRYSVEGNIMSLLYGDDFKGQTSLEGKSSALSYLFFNNKNVTSAENLSLPATTLTDSCYYMMFSYCTNLTTAPSVLPATTLTKMCYDGMFYDCSNLTTAPELPATTLSFRCYYQMFQNCTSLTTAPSVLPATTLASECYTQMFYGCTSLTTAPQLSATTLAETCYYQMFYGTNVLPDCTNIDFSSQSVVASGGLQGLFAGTKLTDAQLDAILKQHGINNYSLPVTTLADSCYSSMFYKCSNLTTAPELPATTLTKMCYTYMFRDCRRLTSIKCLATDISASDCTKMWVRGISSTSGTFIKKASMTGWTTGYNGIPEGWTVQNA